MVGIDRHSPLYCIKEIIDLINKSAFPAAVHSGRTTGDPASKHCFVSLFFSDGIPRISSMRSVFISSRTRSRGHTAGPVLAAPPRISWHFSFPDTLRISIPTFGVGRLGIFRACGKYRCRGPASTENSMPVTLIAGSRPATPRPWVRSRPHTTAPCQRRVRRTAHCDCHPFASLAHGWGRPWRSGSALSSAGRGRGAR